MRRPSPDRPVHRLQAQRLRGRRPALVVMIASIVMALAALTVPVPATAAGNGVLDLTMSPVDASSGNAAITDAKNGSGPAGYASNNTITYLMQYSCGTEACLNTQVQLSTPPADPFGLLPPGEFILKFDSFAPGSSSATIGGTDTTGKLVNLGDLAPGTSGTFAVSYTYQSDRPSEVPNGSFYPDGSQIRMSAEVTSDTAAPVSAQATPVTWHIDAPKTPSVAMNGGTYDPDVAVDFNVAVGGGNMATSSSLIHGDADVPAVGSYTITYRVPAEATINSVSINNGGQVDNVAVIDNVNHTVTWTMGTPNAPVYGARGIHGAPAISAYNGRGAGPNNGAAPDTQAFWGRRTVNLTFDGTAFDPSGCGFRETVQTSVDASVTYLDAVNVADRTTATIVGETRDVTVACQPAFGGMTADKRVTGGQYDVGDGVVSGSGKSAILAQNVPAAGAADRVKAWRVDVRNLGNVPGVAVIDEADLVHDHIKVDSIKPSGGVGATIEWSCTCYILS